MTAVLDACEIAAPYAPDTVEWQQLHASGLGSSEAAAALGISSWESAYSLYLRKTGELDARAVTAEMEWGLRLEPVVADWFLEQHPEYHPTVLDATPCTYRSMQWPWMLASPDRLIETADGSLGVLEIKTAGYWSGRDWDHGAPDEVQVQLIHQMAVLGPTIDHGWIVCLRDRGHPLTFRVERDETTIAALVLAEAAFWKHVTNRTPPAIDGSESTREALKELHKEAVAESTIELPREAVYLRRQRDHQKAQAVHHTLQQREYENRLMALLAVAEYGEVDGLRVVTWRRSVTRRLDIAALRAERPEVAEEFTVTTEGRRLGWPEIAEEA